MVRALPALQGTANPPRSISRARPRLGPWRRALHPHPRPGARLPHRSPAGPVGRTTRTVGRSLAARARRGRVSRRRTRATPASTWKRRRQGVGSGPSSARGRSRRERGKGWRCPVPSRLHCSRGLGPDLLPSQTFHSRRDAVGPDPQLGGPGAAAAAPEEPSAPRGAERRPKGRATEFSDRKGEKATLGSPSCPIPSLESGGMNARAPSIAHLFVPCPCTLLWVRGGSARRGFSLQTDTWGAKRLSTGQQPWTMNSTHYSGSSKSPPPPPLFTPRREDVGPWEGTRTAPLSTPEGRRRATLVLPPHTATRHRRPLLNLGGRL